MDEIRPINGIVKKENIILTEVKTVLLLVFATLFYAITTYVFVLDSDFAPSGLSGILALIEEQWKDLNTGTYVLLLLNAPLLIWAFFSLSKRFAIYTTLSVAIMCTTFFLLEYIDPAGEFRFRTTTEIAGVLYPDFGRRLFCSIISGFCAGISIALTFRVNASLGGVDIIVSLIQKKKPRANVSILLFAVNFVIILASYFVFKDRESICFAIIYIIIFSKVCEYILNGVKKALKFEVVTEHPEELAREIIEKLGHSVTVTPARGMYANTNRSLLICVVRSRQVADFEKILKKYPDSFAFASSVSEVFGLFYK